MNASKGKRSKGVYKKISELNEYFEVGKATATTEI